MRKGSLKAVLLKCHGLSATSFNFCAQMCGALLRPLGDILGLKAFDKDRMALGGLGRMRLERYTPSFGQTRPRLGSIRTFASSL